MKAKIKATGEILEILDIGVSGKYFYLSNDKKYSRNELEFLSETIDYQQVRIQAAIAIVQGWASTPQGLTKVCMAGAVELADALVAELEKGGEQ